MESSVWCVGAKDVGAWLAPSSQLRAFVSPSVGVACALLVGWTWPTLGDRLFLGEGLDYKRRIPGVGGGHPICQSQLLCP